MNTRQRIAGRLPERALAPGGAMRAAAPAPPGAMRRAAPALGAAYRPDLLRLALFTLILINLSRLHNHLGLGVLRPALILTVLAGAYAVANPKLLNTAKLLTFWPAKVIMALAVLACLSAAFGISLGGSASFILEEYSKVLIQAFLLIAAIRFVKDLKYLVWAWVAACGILAYFALFVFQLRSYSGYARLSHMYTFDANDVACIIATGLPLALLAFQTSRGKGRVFAALVMVGIGATLARSGSRGGFVAILAVGLALLLWTPGVNVAKRMAFVAVAAVGLLIAAPPGYWDQMNTITSPREDYNWDAYYGRKKLAERGIGYMFRYPVFGVGIDNFPRADGTMSDRALNFVDGPGMRNRWRAAHNSYIQAGAETGIPGMILWTSLVLGCIVSLSRIRKRLPRAWLRADPDRRFLYLATVYLPVSLVGFAVGSFFVSFAWVDPIYILAAFVIGTQTSLSALAGGVQEPAPAVAGPLPGGRFRPVAARGIQPRHP